MLPACSLVNDLEQRSCCCCCLSNQNHNHNIQNSESKEQKNMSSSQSKCPYASQFIPTPELTSTDNETEDEQRLELEQDKLNLTKNIARCPAFSAKNGTISTGGSSKQEQASSSISCPFRNATSQQDVQRIMLQVPPSHVLSDIIGKHTGDDDSSSSIHSASNETSAQFKRALEVMHSVSKLENAKENNNAAAEQYKMVVSDCPFKNSLPIKTSDSSADDITNGASSFVDVLETQSLESIMSSMDVLQDGGSSNKQDGFVVSTKLKKGTAKAHREAENVSFVRNFIKGKIDRDLYIDMGVALWYVYCALEEELDRHADAHFAALHQPLKLSRKASLERDLEFFLGTEWKTKVKASMATKEYVQRIRAVAAADPILLVAHSYTRYLGDLSGGKVLQRVAKKALGLEKAEDGGVDGLRFYEFNQISEGAKVFKNSYRETLDNMNLTPWQVKRLVGEANVAFVLNMRLFEELDVKAGNKGASVRPLEDALMYLVDLEIVEKQEKEKDEKCPFGFTGKNPHEKKVQVEQKPKLALSEDSNSNREGRCPWPFVLFHDPVTFMRDWQTWVVVGILVSWVYKNFVVMEHN